MLELHLTLSAPSDAEAELRHWAELHDCHVTCIELDRGAFPRQMMLTTRVAGDVAAGMRTSRKLTSALQAIGRVTVKRTKLEAMRGNEPSVGLYLEHHVKVQLVAANIRMLSELGARHVAHVSRNAFRQFSTYEERFLTQRFAAQSEIPPERALDSLLSELKHGGYDVTKVEREVVLIDDNLSLDDGWAKEQT